MRGGRGGPVTPDAGPEAPLLSLGPHGVGRALAPSALRWLGGRLRPPVTAASPVSSARPAFLGHRPSHREEVEAPRQDGGFLCRTSLQRRPGP